METADFLKRLPKAELHLHLEGSLEPELLMALARRNRVSIPFRSVEEIRAAYSFANLQEFLDIYYQGMSVLQEPEDFEALTLAYLERVAGEGVVHVEVFYDPQGHTERGIPLSVATEGILSGLAEGQRRFGISSHLILCFLRHLSEEAGFATYRAAEPYFAAGRILGVGLDSSEKGNPPEKFQRLFEAAGRDGLKRVAHAGEEGPATYVAGALDLLKVDRIDHGNRCLEDPALVARLSESGIALTVCPLSNLRLCVVEELAQHPLKRMLEAGLKATVNSDDPAYFGGYLMDNFLAVTQALSLSRADLSTLARNSIEGSFLASKLQQKYISEINAIEASLAN